MSSKETMLANSLRNMKPDLQTLVMRKSERAKIAKFKPKHRGPVKSWVCFFTLQQLLSPLTALVECAQCGRVRLLQKLASPLTTAGPTVTENILMPTHKQRT